MNSDSQNPYQPPSVDQPGAKPLLDEAAARSAARVIAWQKFYLILMLLLYLAVVVLGGGMVLYRNELANLDGVATSAPELIVMGSVYAFMGIFLSVVYGVGLFWRRGMGGWIYHVVLIGLGLTSCCTWPMTIPLLIFWIKYRTEIMSV